MIDALLVFTLLTAHLSPSTVRKVAPTDANAAFLPLRAKEKAHKICVRKYSGVLKDIRDRKCGK